MRINTQPRKAVSVTVMYAPAGTIKHGEPVLIIEPYLAQATERGIRINAPLIDMYNIQLEKFTPLETKLYQETQKELLKYGFTFNAQDLGSPNISDKLFAKVVRSNAGIILEYSNADARSTPGVAVKLWRTEGCTLTNVQANQLDAQLQATSRTLPSIASNPAGSIEL